MKGLRVWLDLDQKELDDAYDQSVYAPNQPQVTGRYATNSEITRARLGPRCDSPTVLRRRGLDVFAASVPTFGQRICPRWAWRGGLAKNYAFPRSRS